MAELDNIDTMEGEFTVCFRQQQTLFCLCVATLGNVWVLKIAINYYIKIGLWLDLSAEDHVFKDFLFIK